MNAIRKLQEAGGGSSPAAPNTVKGVIERNRLQIEAALPRGVSLERFIQIGTTAIESNPDLRECSRASVMLALIRCCQLGLEPQTPMGHAYIVPFKREATVIVGYRGFVELAWRSSQIILEGHVVRERDEFQWSRGTGPHRGVRHVPSPEPDRGDVTHAWALARFPDDREMFEVMTLGELDSVMMRTRHKGNKGPWKTDRAEMQRKTVIRRLAKLLPLNPDAVGPAHARVIDEAPYDPNVLQLPEDASGPFMGPAGASPAPVASVDEQVGEPKPVPRALRADPDPLSDSDIVVDEETGALLALVDGEVDWKNDDVQELAFEALKAAMVENPHRATDYLKANARVLAGFSGSRVAALNHVLAQATTETPAPPPANGDGGAEAPSSDDDAWMRGL